MRFSASVYYYFLHFTIHSNHSLCQLSLLFSVSLSNQPYDVHRQFYMQSFTETFESVTRFSAYIFAISRSQRINSRLLLFLSRPAQSSRHRLDKIKMVATAIYSVTMLFCGKKRHFLFGEPWRGAGKGMLSPWCLLWQWWYACQSLVWAQWPYPAMYTSCLYGKWVEDVCAGQFGVFVYLVLCCFIIIITIIIIFWPRSQEMKKITLCNTKSIIINFVIHY